MILCQRHLCIRRRRPEELWDKPALGWEEIHDRVDRLPKVYRRRSYSETFTW